MNQLEVADALSPYHYDQRININRRKHDKDDTAFDTFDWYASATLAPVSLPISSVYRMRCFDAGVQGGKLLPILPWISNSHRQVCMVCLMVQMPSDQNISSWNMGNVTDMSCMFCGASAFNQTIKSWNAGSVTSMYAIARAFNQPLDSWNTGSVTSLEEMFAFASAFNQPLDSWITGRVTSMYGMFYGASAFDQNISSYIMFDKAKASNQPLDSWNTGSGAKFGRNVCIRNQREREGWLRRGRRGRKGKGRKGSSDTRK